MPIPGFWQPYPNSLTEELQDVNTGPLLTARKGNSYEMISLAYLLFWLKP